MRLQEDRAPNAMSYYHNDGLKAAWQMAMRFAGEVGHIATLPEIIRARLNTKPGDTPWETWFTTSSAEYVGYDRDGVKKIVVAHGVGPMSTLDGIMKAYSWEYKGKSRDHRGGRISQEEFWKLLDGVYGKVYVVDFDSYAAKFTYPFGEHLTSWQAMRDRLLEARLGNDDFTEYITRHTQEARKWHLEQAKVEPENRFNLPDHDVHCVFREVTHLRKGKPASDPFIVSVKDAANCSYMHLPIEEGMAFAHLLSISRLQEMHHNEGEPSGVRSSYESLTFDVSAHEWWNGNRFVGVRNGEILNIVPGPDPRALLLANWQKLTSPTNEARVGFRALIKLPDGTWFTQYEKPGASFDTAEPEFQVTSIEKIGEPTKFLTKVWGYYGLFRYQIKDVQALAPTGANAYVIVGDPELVPESEAEFQTAMVQFYRIEVDSTKRVERQKDIENDFDLLMSLMNDDPH